MQWWLAHLSKELAEATARNISEAVSTIARIRLVVSDRAQTATQMAARNVSAADTLATINQQTRYERADIAKHLGSLRELTQGMDAMAQLKKCYRFCLADRLMADFSAEKTTKCGADASARQAAPAVVTLDGD